MEARVLVVEDDEDVMELLRDVLRLYGHAPIGVRHPDLVPDVAAYERPDIFVIDVMLPSMSGIEVAQKLRLNGFERTPMIALSASPIMRDLALHTGLFDKALTKPFDIGRLVECIEAVLERGTEWPGAIGQLEKDSRPTF